MCKVVGTGIGLELGSTYLAAATEAINNIQRDF